MANSGNSAAVAPRAVELQLLRHGPSHNQLLSPLTDYLALCGDHPSSSLRIPLEHSALLTRLRALRYHDSEETRRSQIDETSRIVSDAMASVPGLIAELSSGGRRRDQLVHLSIATNAAELALVPFELAIAPGGTPGAGQPMCLQTEVPICLTRRSRNARNDDFDWDRPPRILLVASEAGGPIPLRQHYAVLRKLVDPWLSIYPGDTEAQRRVKRRRILQVLARADIDSLEQLLDKESFTHIHVLAHGCVLPGDDRRFGLAFHDTTSEGGVDAVSGARLGRILGRRPRVHGAYCPTVVTLAACDSAGQGGVQTPGSSVAFEIHDSGVPLVVGSQFPLSFDGSVVMTETLYHGFLNGIDPRRVVWETRRALRARSIERLASAPGMADAPTAHDWASLTVYAALPGNLDQVLPRHRRARVVARMNNSLAMLDDFIAGKGQGAGDNVDDQLIARVRREVKRFSRFVAEDALQSPRDRAQSEGILASALKRLGLAFVTISQSMQQARDGATSGTETALGAASDLYAEMRKEWWDLLAKSRDAYGRVIHNARSEGWALVQYLVNAFALTREALPDVWVVAMYLIRADLAAACPQKRAWATAGLAELKLLQWAWHLANAPTSHDPRPGLPLKAYAMKEAARFVKDTFNAASIQEEILDLLRTLVDLRDEAPFELASTWKQLARYRVFLYDFTYVKSTTSAHEAALDTTQLFAADETFRELLDFLDDRACALLAEFMVDGESDDD